MIASSKRVSSPTGWPVATSHIRTDLSSEQVATRRPSGLNSAQVTGASCFSGGVSSCDLAASQSRAVPSKEAVTIRVPSGLSLATASSEPSGWRIGGAAGTGNRRCSRIDMANIAALESLGSFRKSVATRASACDDSPFWSIVSMAPHSRCATFSVNVALTCWARRHCHSAAVLPAIIANSSPAASPASQGLRWRHRQARSHTLTGRA